MNVFVGSYLDPNIHGTLKPRRGGISGPSGRESESMGLRFEAGDGSWILKRAAVSVLAGVSELL